LLVAEDRLAMPKRSPRIKLFEWRVIKIRSTPAALVGYFTAANADDAIKRAIVEREISDPLTQSRLAAQKVREIERLDINDAKEGSEMDISRLRPPAGRDERLVSRPSRPFFSKQASRRSSAIALPSNGTRIVAPSPLTSRTFDFRRLSLKERSANAIVTPFVSAKALASTD